VVVFKKGETKLGGGSLGARSTKNRQAGTPGEKKGGKKNGIQKVSQQQCDIPASARQAGKRTRGFRRFKGGEGKRESGVCLGGSRAKWTTEWGGGGKKKPDATYRGAGKGVATQAARTIVLFGVVRGKPSARRGGKDGRGM